MTPRIIVANLGVRLKSFYRERSAMFFTFAFPVILVLVFGTIFTKPEHLNFDLPVQDNSGSNGSARLLEALTAGGDVRIGARHVHIVRLRQREGGRLALLDSGASCVDSE